MIQSIFVIELHIHFFQIFLNESILTYNSYNFMKALIKSHFPVMSPNCNQTTFLIPLYSFLDMPLFFFFLFFCHTHNIWKFLGQGLNPHHNNDLSRWIFNTLNYKRTPLNMPLYLCSLVSLSRLCSFISHPSLVPQRVGGIVQPQYKCSGKINHFFHCISLLFKTIFFSCI